LKNRKVKIVPASAQNMGVGQRVDDVAENTAKMSMASKGNRISCTVSYKVPELSLARRTVQLFLIEKFGEKKNNFPLCCSQDCGVGVASSPRFLGRVGCFVRLRKSNWIIFTSHS